MGTCCTECTALFNINHSASKGIKAQRAYLTRFSHEWVYPASRSPCDFQTLRLGLNQFLISQQAHPGDPGTSVAWYRLSVHAFLTLPF